MHPHDMPSRSISVEWEDIMETDNAIQIKERLEKKFPKYDFHVGGSIGSFRHPRTIQVARGLSDNEFHVILGYCTALEEVL